MGIQKMTVPETVQGRKAGFVSYPTHTRNPSTGRHNARLGMRSLSVIKKEKHPLYGNDYRFGDPRCYLLQILILGKQRYRHIV